MTTGDRMRGAEVLEKATPRPWKHGPLFWEGWAPTEDGGGTRVFEVPHVYPNGAHQPGVWVDPDIGRSREPDAALIVAAVNDYERLLRIEKAARAYHAFIVADPPLPDEDSPYDELEAALDGP